MATGSALVFLKLFDKVYAPPHRWSAPSVSRRSNYGEGSLAATRQAVPISHSRPVTNWWPPSASRLPPDLRLTRTNSPAAGQRSCPQVNRRARLCGTRRRRPGSRLQEQLDLQALPLAVEYNYAPGLVAEALGQKVLAKNSRRDAHPHGSQRPLERGLHIAQDHVGNLRHSVQDFGVHHRVFGHQHL